MAMNWACKTGLAALILCGPAASAQTTSCLERTIPAGVADEHGLRVGGLSAADYRLKIGGKESPIVSLSRAPAPHRILILMDARGNMQGPDGKRWKTAVSVAEGLAQSKQPDVTLALFVFGKKANERVGFSAGNQAVRAKLDQIGNNQKYYAEHVRGPSVLYDAIREALRSFGPMSPGDSIFAITSDGHDESQTSTRSATESLDSGGLRLFVMIFSLGYLEATNVAVRDLANNTGGLVLQYPGGPDDPIGTNVGTEPDVISAFDAALPTFYSLMAQSDLLQIELTSPLKKSTDLKLTLSKETSRRLKNANIFYQHRLEPCTPARP